MESYFEELRNLIDYVQVAYSAITQKWLEQTQPKINLKRTLISDIDANGDIYGTIKEYVQLLNVQSANVTLKLSSVCTAVVTARVKAQNSIEYKIQRYKGEEHEFGKVAINKCLNDLFGVRIILPQSCTFEQIAEFIKDEYQGKYKCIDSSNHDYKATHIYFKEGNKVFPWELQIWNAEDVERNFISHREYKQEYVTWEKESKEGGLSDG